MLTIITPTKNRFRAFQLLEGYIGKQTYKGEIQWIVVNDGTEKYEYSMGQEVISRDPSTDPKDMTSICLNYAAAIPLIRGDKILICEDDDFYRENYIDSLVDALDKFQLIGVSPAYYYHISSRKWRNLHNSSYASLAATGFTRELLPIFSQACGYSNMIYLDLWLWCHWTETLRQPFHLIKQSESAPIQIGIKGLPYGVRGLGLGHDPVPGCSDRCLVKFKQWMGQDWLNYYNRDLTIKR